MLTTSDGGQIFGFDINSNGNDGFVASASSSQISVQTFNETSGKITKTIGWISGKRVLSDDYVADGIFAGDVGLVDLQKADGLAGKKPVHDVYHLLNPVTKNSLNGRWIPPVKLFNVLEWAPNQSTSTSVVYGYQREGSVPSELIVSDVGKNTFGKVISLSSTDFSQGTQPQLAQDTVNNLAVMATSPSFGAAGGPPPVIWTIDLKSGKKTHFSGVSCPGSVGCGYANGIGYDSSTGTACTTTELDAGVEFYNVAKQTGIRVQLPNNASQLSAGAFVANDAVHGLFLIAQPVSTTGSGSSIQVYNESGTLEESINGFNFSDASTVIPVRISINPTSRTGWVNGPQVDQLQEFSY
ncbi:MAG TPA: hypothetical protein VKR56_08535 [Candidatus Cybelea sp.]|nr:hypothetical protein [Candidatus Cybelea sp.]